LSAALIAKYGFQGTSSLAQVAKLSRSLDRGQTPAGALSEDVLRFLLSGMNNLIDSLRCVRVTLALSSAVVGAPQRARKGVDRYAHRRDVH